MFELPCRRHGLFAVLEDDAGNECITAKIPEEVWEESRIADP